MTIRPSTVPAMRIDDVRAFALALPEAHEEPHFDLSSFRIGKKVFATVTPDERHLRIFAGEDDVHAAVAEHPASCSVLMWGAKLSGVEVLLSKAKRSLVEELLVEAWRRKAPKKLVAAYDASA